MGNTQEVAAATTASKHRRPQKRPVSRKFQAHAVKLVHSFVQKEIRGRCTTLPAML
jgi:hypothetical protein